ncbi:MAG: class I SAM-dependent methyltransferase [Verrucomicrobiales bacterium]
MNHQGGKSENPRRRPWGKDAARGAPRRGFGSRGESPARDARETHRDAPASDRGWDAVASWYDKLVGEQGSDYHRHVIIPAVMEMLALRSGEVVLDLCCGQGVMVRPLIAAGAGRITGVDASPKLIAAARKRYALDGGAEFLVADATRPGPWTNGTFDAAVCVLAVHDVADMEALFRQLGAALKPGGRAVLVVMHPCFRIPRQSHWGWDEERKIQFRRLDCYQSPIAIPITTHPGRGGAEQTLFHHRSLEAYLNALGQAGLGVTGASELATHRRSQPGPRSRGEHRAAREFPVFLALKVTSLRARGK